MKLLLDTHAFLWALHDPSKLSEISRRALQSGDNSVYFSPASIWEIAIKCSKKRLFIDGDFGSAIRKSEFSEIPIASSHAWRVRQLPWHHSDPFDRLLVAQAIEESMTLVTRDHILTSYPVNVMEA